MIIFYHWGCSEPVGPKLPIEPRELVWEVDTLYAVEFGEPTLQTAMGAIWASSPNNVYIVGHNTALGGLNGSESGKGYHFDGERWENLPLRGRKTLNDITGFSPNNIIAAGERRHENPDPPPTSISTPLIMNYDGSQWTEQSIEAGIRINTITGTSLSNVWAGGGEYVWRYDGTSWRELKIPIQIPDRAGGPGVNGLAIHPNTNDLYILCRIVESDIVRTTRYFLKYSNGEFVVIDSAVTQSSIIEIKWGYRDLWFSPTGNLYSAGHGVFLWNGMDWERIFDRETGLTSIYGTHDSNIFVVGNFGKVYHFNGIEWYSFDEFRDDNVLYTDVWTDGESVFVVGYTLSYPMKTIVLRGK